MTRRQKALVWAKELGETPIRYRGTKGSLSGKPGKWHYGVLKDTGEIRCESGYVGICPIRPRTEWVVIKGGKK